MVTIIITKMFEIFKEMEMITVIIRQFKNHFNYYDYQRYY